MNTPFPVRKDGKFSVEEYFALIESRPEEERWQLIDGVAMMMPPPTLVHQRIASNMARHLNNHVEAQHINLHAYQEVGLIVPEAELFRPEADVAVLDDTADYESYSNKFYLAAEILSDSNTDKDIAVKRQRYLQHPDNLYFMLIEQKRVRVEVLARAGGWQPVVRSAGCRLGYSRMGLSCRAGGPLSGYSARGSDTALIPAALLSQPGWLHLPLCLPRLDSPRALGYARPRGWHSIRGSANSPLTTKPHRGEWAA